MWLMGIAGGERTRAGVKAAQRRSLNFWSKIPPGS
jgi:hypothetical protein